MDAVQKANSGHPGTPMALAPLGYTLWQNFLNYDPQDPNWPNRDRFVLSVGHASMLLYSLLFLSGVKGSITLEDIRNFRQLKYKTPGHPENHVAPGIETTTGPLGQGFANSVGMAIAERYLEQKFNRPDFELFRHNVYAIGGDGCMMEGVTSEAASLAGHLKLSNLCWFYDNNQITIDGNTKITFTEDVALRFKAYGWSVLHVDDANDINKINRCIETFQKTVGMPTLIIVDSHIGWGSSKQDKSAAHGEPLGEEVIKATKKFYGWPENEKFLVPNGVRENFTEKLGSRGQKLNRAWKELYSAYKENHPGLTRELELIEKRELPEGWDKDLPEFKADPKALPTRESSGLVMNAIAENISWFIGGSADLAVSAKTTLKFEGAGSFEPGQYDGRNLHFGIREHAMGAVTNGINLSKVRAYGSTFLIFSDYQKPAVRLAALMEIPNIFIYTHDSIGLGEDGPTHQPIEQLAGLRAIPGLIVLRPADANEVVESWKIIMRLQHQPAALALSRQGTPTLDRTKYHSAKGAAHGAYVIAGDPEIIPDVILMATGSEVALTLEAYEILKSEGIKVRVVSMPSLEIFEKQSQSYRDKVLPPGVLARISVEASTTLGWQKYTGLKGRNIGLTTFGASAPLKDLYEHFGLTPSKIAQAARDLIK